MAKDNTKTDIINSNAIYVVIFSLFPFAIILLQHKCEPLTLSCL